VRSIRKTLFVNIVLFPLLILVLVGLFFSVVLYQTESEKARQFIEERNKLDTYRIESLFSKFYVTVEVLSHLREIRLAPFVSEEDRARALYLYRLVKEADEDVNYIYSGYETGLLLINDYVPPEGYDPTVRPWYVAALGSSPEISEGIPYREIKTKEWLISIGKVLLDDNGEVTGVLAMETSLERLLSMLRGERGPYKSYCTYVIKERDQTVILHPDLQLLGKTIKAVIRGEGFPFSGEGGFVEYESGGRRKIVHYTRARNLGWIIVTEVDKEEVIAPIFMKVTLGLLVVGIVAVGTGSLLVRLLTKRIIGPLTALKRQTERAIGGEFRDPGDYEYPEDEIGAIARDVIQLTRDELYKKNRELVRLNRELENMATTDNLTLLPNRRKMEGELERAFYLWKRYGRPFSLIMLDIDDFKGVNDRLGHLVGDKVLWKVAHVLRTSLRRSDLAARWGGDEFLILCPETSLEEAIKVAEKIRKKVEEHDFGVGQGVTVSIGVAEVGDHTSVDELITEADNKMYEAKRQGKNRTVA